MVEMQQPQRSRAKKKYTEDSNEGRHGGVASFTLFVRRKQPGRVVTLTRLNEAKIEVVWGNGTRCGDRQNMVGRRRL